LSNRSVEFPGEDHAGILSEIFRSAGQRRKAQDPVIHIASPMYSVAEAVVIGPSGLFRSEYESRGVRSGTGGAEPRAAVASPS